MYKNPYKPFSNTDVLNNWDKLLKMTREQVVELQSEWERIHEENKEIGKVISKEYTEKLILIEETMKNAGVEIYKYKKKDKWGIDRIKNGYLKWFETNVAKALLEKYPRYTREIPNPIFHASSKEVNGIKLHTNNPRTIVALYDQIKRQYDGAIIRAVKSNTLLIKSVEYATLHNIDIEGLDSKGIISEVRDHAVEVFLDKEIPAGTEIYLKHECDNCSTYISGEHRCSCGSVRIGITVGGNILEGFYYYTEKY